MQSNITQRLGERLIHRRQAYSSRENAKTINEELLAMVSHIRSLQDQLLAEQYRQELLVEQNQVYKSRLEKLNSRNDMQRQRINTLEEEYELHKIKNNELQMCEESLRSIYQEINDLTKVIEDRAEECDILSRESRRIRKENNELNEQNAELEERQECLTNQLNSFLASFAEDRRYQSTKPISELGEIIDRLRNELISLETEHSRIQREGNTTLSLEKQAIIKLQFEYQLLKERAKDEDKLQKLNEICTNESNLESVVEEMLIKQDEFIDKLNFLERQHQRIQKQYQAMLENVGYEQDESIMRAESQLRGLQIQRDRIKTEIKQTEYKLVTKTERYQEIYQEQEMSLRMDINLNSLKRLRQVEERNKYLKLKINELEETKVLLKQEKELLHSSF